MKLVSVLCFVGFMLLSAMTPNSLRNSGKRYDPIVFADFFSPNGDGHNDFFVIQNIEEYPINKLHVFNRWGDKVFEAEPYQNDWGGKVNIKNQFLGDDVPDGTYFYRFEYLIGDFPMRKNGKIILKR